MCRTIGILQHYFWMTCFLIMTTVSFDFFHRFSNFCKPWYLKKSSMSFCNLSFCWVLGIVLIAIPVCLDLLTQLPITYGSTRGICFIEPRLYLICFFIGPSLLLFFINTMCFVVTTINICRILPSDAEVAAASDRNMAVIFMKIGGLMGVAWLFALVPYITGIEEFWYVFVIMNGLQGIYIFMSSGIMGLLKKMFSQNQQGTAGTLNAAGIQIETQF